MVCSLLASLASEVRGYSSLSITPTPTLPRAYLCGEYASVSYDAVEYRARSTDLELTAWVPIPALSL